MMVILVLAVLAWLIFAGLLDVTKYLKNKKQMDFNQKSVEKLASTIECLKNNKKLNRHG